MNTSDKILKQDITILRDLARTVAEIAALPIQEERKYLWKCMNSLRPKRPLVAVYPERAWEELVPERILQCENGTARIWEKTLRQTIFHHDNVPDDRPLHNKLMIPWKIIVGSDGADFKTLHPSGDGPEAIAWDPPIRSFKDVDKLYMPDIIIDRDTTHATFELAGDIFGDILEVMLWGGQPWWSVGISQLIHYRGLQQTMIDMYENPEVLHRILSHLRDKQMRFMDVLEEENVLTLNNSITAIDYFMGAGHEGFTNELPASDFNGKVRWIDMWGLGDMQEFSGVGPDHFYEFSLQYQLPLLHRFGLVNYGCCEPLDSVYDMLMENIPKLRRLSVTSPYAKIETAANALKRDYIIAWKPNPTPIALPSVNWEEIEKDMINTLRVTEGCCLEIVMKSTETFFNDVSRVTKWVELSQRLVQEHAL